MATGKGWGWNPGRRSRCLSGDWPVPGSQQLLFYHRAGCGNWDSQQVQAGCGWQHLEELAQSRGSVQEQWERGHTTAVTEHPAPQSLSVWGNCCSLAVGAASLELLPPTSVATWRQPALPGTDLHPREHFPGASTPGSFPRCHCFLVLPSTPWFQGTGEALWGCYMLLP